MYVVYSLLWKTLCKRLNSSRRMREIFLNRKYALIFLKRAPFQKLSLWLGTCSFCSEVSKFGLKNEGIDRCIVLRWWRTVVRNGSWYNALLRVNFLEAKRRTELIPHEVTDIKCSNILDDVLLLSFRIPRCSSWRSPIPLARKWKHPEFLLRYVNS